MWKAKLAACQSQHEIDKAEIEARVSSLKAQLTKLTRDCQEQVGQLNAKLVEATREHD